MPVVLKIDTKSVFHEPLEIEIDGAILRIRPITLASLELIQGLQDNLMAGSAKAIRETLETLIDGGIAPLLNVSIGRVQEIITVLIEKSIKVGTEEKNGSGPGDKLLP